VGRIKASRRSSTYIMVLDMWTAMWRDDRGRGFIESDVVGEEAISH
jgi:hypothetical protein